MTVRISTAVGDLDQPLQIGHPPIEPVGMPTDDRVDLPSLDRVQQSLETGSGAVVGAQVVVVEGWVDDLPAEVFGQRPAVLELAGHAGALTGGVVADADVDRGGGHATHANSV